MMQGKANSIDAMRFLGAAVVVFGLPTTAACGSDACGGAACALPLTIEIAPKSSAQLPAGAYEVSLVLDGAPKTITCHSEPGVGPGCTDGDTYYDPDLVATQGPTPDDLEYIRLQFRKRVKLIELKVSREGVPLLATTLKPTYTLAGSTCGEACFSALERLEVD